MVGYVQELMTLMDLSVLVERDTKGRVVKVRDKSEHMFIKV